MSQNIPSEELNIVNALVQLSFLIQGVLARVAAAHDLSLVQMRLFGILRDRNLGMLEVAQYLGLDKSSVTGLIDRAERRGLVQRSSVPEDGRAIRVTVTPQGRQITAEVADEVEREINQLVAELSEADKQQFIAIASRFFK